MDIQIKRIIKLGNLVIPVLKGDKGDKGEQGKQGVTGQDGYTPIRGIDYWNQEDKDAIKQEMYAEIDPKLDNKVDKEQGKGLSTNDFTNILKEKLENLENYNDEEIRKLLNGSLKNVNYTASNGMLTFTKNDGSTISVDLPLELLIESGRYDEANKQIVLTLANGNVINIPISDLLDDFYDKGETYNKTEIDNIIAEKQALIEKLELENKSQQEEIDMLTADYRENTVEGETAIVTDSLPNSKVSIIGDGNSYQETTEGYNLLPIPDMEEKTYNGVTYSIKNGVIKINGTCTESFDIWISGKSSIPSMSLSSDTYTFGAKDIQGSFTGTVGKYIRDTITGVNIIDGNLLGYLVKKTLESDYSSISAYIFVAKKSVFTNYSCKLMLLKGSYTSDTFSPYEPYTGGQASPNTDYPQEYEVIDMVNRLDVEQLTKIPTTIGTTFDKKTGWLKIENTRDAQSYVNIQVPTKHIIGGKSYTLKVEFADTNRCNVFLQNASSDYSKVMVANGSVTNTAINDYMNVLVTPQANQTVTVRLSLADEKINLDDLPYLPYGHIGLVQRGKNLLNINISSKTINGVTVTNNGDGTITLNGTPTSPGAKIPISDMRINANIGEKITLTHKYISGNVTRHTGGFILLLYYAQATTESLLVNKTETISSTQTVKENITDTPYLWVGYDVNNGQGFVTFDNYTFALQVEKGSVATPIEPYHTPIVHPIDLAGNSLAKVGEIADKLKIGVNGSVKIGDKVIKEYVFTGDEIWDRFTVAGSTTNYRHHASFMRGLIVGPPTNADISNVLCNMLIAKSPNQTYFSQEGISIDPDGTIRIYSNKTKEMTTDEFKNWLKSLYEAGTPLRILYETTEPTTIDLPSIEPITLFEGTNVFELITNLGTTLAVTYKVSNKSRLEALENAILSLGGISNV